MPTLYAAPGLSAFTITLGDGSERTVLASSMQSAVQGIWPAPITNAATGAAFDPNLPPPVANSLSPATAVIGDPDFTLHVLGTGFGPGAVIVWNGGEEPTTFVSATELTTLVNMATAVVPGPIPVSVRALGGVESAPLTFSLTATAGADAAAS